MPESCNLEKLNSHVKDWHGVYSRHHLSHDHSTGPELADTSALHQISLSRQGIRSPCLVDHQWHCGVGLEDCTPRQARKSCHVKLHPHGLVCLRIWLQDQGLC